MNLKQISTAALVAIGLLYSVQVIGADKKCDHHQLVITDNEEQKSVPNKVSGWFTPHKDIPLSAELQAFTAQQAKLNGVPYVLVLAVMEQESRFKLDADGGDSFGLMQINECHGPREIIIEPHENIKIGCWLLGHLHREYRDWNKALVAYNCGQAGAEQMYFRHGSLSSPSSRAVMLRSERFAALLGEESVLRPR